MSRSKQVTTVLIVLIAIAACAVLFFSPYAYAEESVTVSADASVTVTASTSPRRTAPLRILKSEIEEKRTNIERAVTEKREAIKERVENTRADIKANIEARVTERKGTAEGRRESMASSTNVRAELKARANIENVVLNMIKRLTAATERFDNIASRIDSRLEKLKSEGKDISAAAALQTTAKAKIAEAKTAISAIVKPELSDNATREELKATFDGVRAKIKTAEEAVKAAHKALLEVIAAVKRIDASISAGASANAEAN